LSDGVVEEIRDRLPADADEHTIEDLAYDYIQLEADPITPEGEPLRAAVR
jgi:hypothetical protein